MIVVQWFFESSMCNLIKIFTPLDLASIGKLLYHEVFLENLLLSAQITFLFKLSKVTVYQQHCLGHVFLIYKSIAVIPFTSTGQAQPCVDLNRFLKCKQFSVPLLMTLYGDLFYCFCPTFVPFTQITQNKNIQICSTYYLVKYKSCKLFILKDNKAKVDSTFFKLFQLNLLNSVSLSYLTIA